MASEQKGPFTVLLKIWLIVSTFTNVIALASLADGVIAWSDFIQHLIESYQSIRDSVWGNLFQLIGIDLPNWMHDYFTINSIFAVSLLWAMIDAGQSISSGKLNSAIRYFKNSLLDFTVGADLPKSFAKEATEELARIGQAVTKAQSDQLEKLARPIVSIYTVSKSALMALVALMSYLLFSFVFHWVIQFNDYWDAKLARFEFRRLHNRVHAIPWDAAQRDIVLTIFRSRVDQFAAFAAMDGVFHDTLQRSLVRYLIAVSAIFFLLVFVNQVLTALF